MRDVLNPQIATPKLDRQRRPFPSRQLRGSGLAGCLDDLGRGRSTSTPIPPLPLIQRITDGGKVIRRELGASDQRDDLLSSNAPIAVRVQHAPVVVVPLLPGCRDQGLGRSLRE